MKKLIIYIILLIPYTAMAQSSFFAGLHGGVHSTTLLNKEDKAAPKGVLDKKNGMQMSYGLQIGYSYKHRVQLSIAPYVLNYKINYNGGNDTTNMKKFDAEVNLKYIQIPLILSYTHPIGERWGINAGVGMSYDILEKYSENLYSKQSPLGDISGEILQLDILKKNYNEIATLDEKNRWESVYDKWNYKKNTLSLNIFGGISFNVSDYFQFCFKAFYIRGIKDIENKVIIHSKQTWVTNNGFVTNFEINQWNESRYRRYYYRWEDKYNERGDTYIQSVGLVLSIQYYISGGLLPSIHKQ